MNVIELDCALRKLRLSGMAGTLEMRLVQAQAEKMVPLDLVSVLVGDELTRREDRLLERRIKQASFREANKTLDAFDFDFNKKMDRERCTKPAWTWGWPLINGRAFRKRGGCCRQRISGRLACARWFRRSGGGRRIRSGSGAATRTV